MKYNIAKTITILGVICHLTLAAIYTKELLEKR